MKQNCRLLPYDGKTCMKFIMRLFLIMPILFIFFSEIVPCVEACCPLYLMWLPFCWPKGACRKREIDAIEAMIRAKRVVNDQDNKFKAENIFH